MTKQTLQTLIDAAGSPLNYARSTKFHVRDNPAFYPPIVVPQIPYEFSAWEREQRAWRDSVALLDQSHHMHPVIVRGPDAKAFLSHLACNNLSGANPSRGYQIICTAPDGNLVGDGVLLQLGENEFSAIGPNLLSWIPYQAQTLDFDVEVELQPRSPIYANGHGNTRPDCRYQIQGPNAWALLEELNGAAIPDMPFFSVTEIKVGGIPMKGLRHGMAGTPGLEIWGPWEQRDHIRETILSVGQAYGIMEAGAFAYASSGVESGWLQGVVPAIYADEALRGYREFLDTRSIEAIWRLTGSYAADSIEAYYRSPIDVGYGRFVHFGHEFIGRDALQAKKDAPALQKVTLAWNPEDGGKLLQEMLRADGRDVKMLHMPNNNDKLELNYDKLTMGGKDIGCAHYTAYLSTARAMLTLAFVDESVQIGDEVELHWGELGGGFGNYMAQPTEVQPIRAIVSPSPYSKVAREEYRTTAR